VSTKNGVLTNKHFTDFDLAFGEGEIEQFAICSDAEIDSFYCHDLEAGQRRSQTE
jgi:hypothetical protein